MRRVASYHRPDLGAIVANLPVESILARRHPVTVRVELHINPAGSHQLHFAGTHYVHELFRQHRAEVNFQMLCHLSLQFVFLAGGQTVVHHIAADRHRDFSRC